MKFIIGSILIGLPIGIILLFIIHVQILKKIDLKAVLEGFFIGFCSFLLGILLIFSIYSGFCFILL